MSHFSRVQEDVVFFCFYRGFINDNIPGKNDLTT